MNYEEFVFIVFAGDDTDLILAGCKTCEKAKGDCDLRDFAERQGAASAYWGNNGLNRGQRYPQTQTTPCAYFDFEEDFEGEKAQIKAFINFYNALRDLQETEGQVEIVSQYCQPGFQAIYDLERE